MEHNMNQSTISGGLEFDYHGWMITTLEDWLGWQTYMAGPNGERLELYPVTKEEGEQMARALIDAGGGQGKLL